MLLGSTYPYEQARTSAASPYRCYHPLPLLLPYARARRARHLHAPVRDRGRHARWWEPMPSAVGRRPIGLRGPSEGSGRAYAPRSAASAAWRLAVASAARLGPTKNGAFLPLFFTQPLRPASSHFSARTAGQRSHRSSASARCLRRCRGRGSGPVARRHCLSGGAGGGHTTLDTAV